MHFLKQFHKYTQMIKIVMESNSFKPKSHARHFANNSGPTKLDMDIDRKMKHKTRHTDENFNPDKENSNPNARQKTHCNVLNSNEMINQKVNSEASCHVKDKPSQSNDSGDQCRQPTQGGKPVPQGYIDAIKQLNTLQSNVRALKDSKVKRDPALTKAVQVDQVLHYLGLLNVTQDDIAKLRFIHISGTKGKGSTSAYCESILRAHGLTTGFYSSPHLIEVRERIRLNGQPVGYDKFTKYFWKVYNTLYANRRNPDDMPAYFKFLTVMSFYMFVKEKPDVCIMEVGIGGLYDNTNIIPNTDVVGITSLGFDHTAVLGNSIEEICTQKAGIIKPKSFVATARGQEDECKQILLDKALALGCSIFEAPNIFMYEWNDQPLEDDWHTTFQAINISLAIQLAYLMLFRLNKEGRFVKDIKQAIEIIDTQRRFLKTFPQENPFPKYKRPPHIPQGCDFKIDNVTYRGIKKCVWPGRVQVIKRDNYTYFIDGAHTDDSITKCAKWFHWKSIDLGIPAEAKNITPDEDGGIGLKGMAYLNSLDRRGPQSYEEDEPDQIVRILVFNVTGDRDPEQLLPPLIKRNKFHYVLVTPNVISSASCPDVQYGGNRTVDRYGNKISIGQHDHEKSPHSSTQHDHIDQSNVSVHAVTESIRAGFFKNLEKAEQGWMPSQIEKLQKIVDITSEQSSFNQTTVVGFDNVLDTYKFFKAMDPNAEYHVLVTGSLHLVGAFLNVLTNYEES